MFLFSSCFTRPYHKILGICDSFCGEQIRFLIISKQYGTCNHGNHKPFHLPDLLKDLMVFAKIGTKQNACLIDLTLFENAFGIVTFFFINPKTVQTYLTSAPPKRVYFSWQIMSLLSNRQANPMIGHSDNNAKSRGGDKHQIC